MAFKIRSGPSTFRWQVTFHVPEDGKHAKKEFFVMFTRIPAAEMAAAGATLIEAEGADTLPALKAVALKVVDRFVDLTNDEGKVYEDKSEAIDALEANYPQAIGAIVQSYIKAIGGPESEQAAARKN